MLSIFPFLLGILTSLPNLILTAEKAFSGALGSGEAKKKLVMDSTATALALAGSVENAAITPEQSALILEGVSQLTDATVETLNTVNALGDAKA